MCVRFFETQRAFSIIITQRRSKKKRYQNYVQEIIITYLYVHELEYITLHTLTLKHLERKIKYDDCSM